MTERELFEAHMNRQNVFIPRSQWDGIGYESTVIDRHWNTWQAGRAPLLARIAELETELLAQCEKNVLLTVCLRQVEDGEGK